MTVTDNSNAGRFEIALGDGQIAFAEYKLLANGKILFPHTLVPQGQEGQGIGTRLIEAALASARERGLQVMPQCPFFASYMKRHAETHDLLDPAYARLLGV